MESTVEYLERSATADAWTGPRHRSRVFPKIGRKTETWSETRSTEIPMVRVKSKEWKNCGKVPMG
jgi:hypothetical protein